ncbi:MAG: MmcQ/YjbR family DNA-binding protein [Prevotellaceae bacterium]|jgi:hypothetical protein|nr:MmcQ/YjbR family DNA-binding protein [Prevotellaceae bacterium]
MSEIYSGILCFATIKPVNNEYRNHMRTLLTKAEVTESSPFGDDNIVFKVCDKIFVLLSLDKP